MKLIKHTTLKVAIIAGLISTATPLYAQNDHHEAKAGPTSIKVAQTSAALRDLWLGHAFWVRNVVVETLAGNKTGAIAAENEVVANAKELAAAIEPFYGKAAADKLFSLLSGHYGAIKQHLEAVVTGSSKKEEAAMKAITDNVEEISVFLSGANPNLPHDAVQGLLLAHVGHHKQQIQQLHDKQYPQEAQTWDAMKKHMYVIADTLAGALATQFPARF